MTRFRIGQIASGEQLRIKLLVIAHILPMKTLAVDLIYLVELQARFRLEGGESSDGLCSQSAAVDQEQDASTNTSLHEPVHLIDHRKGLARPCGHCQEH